MANDFQSKRQQFMKSIKVDQSQLKNNQQAKKAQFNSNGNGNKGEAPQRQRSLERGRGMER